MLSKYFFCFQSKNNIWMNIYWQIFGIVVINIFDMNQLIIKKDFFIKSRQEDIREIYQFSPKVLGRGAYGIVYKARLKEPPHTYRVVKLIAKRMVKNPESLQNEIEILKKLDHPMIVRLYETFEDEKNLYLVQDFCEGGQLFGRLQTHGNFSEADARELFTQIIKCIRYMHSQKIAHRDLKPENFLMNSKKTLQLKIIDFGLSYQWKENMRNEMMAEKKNKLIGTSYYIAPEVLKLDYDQRCDIWSAGVILYILVTAAPPFDGKDDREIMENVKKLQYTFDIPEAKGLSHEVKDLIKRILVPADKRITIEEILAHPWMTKPVPQAKLTVDFKKMRNFSNFSKFKTLVMTYIATQLPEKEIHHLGILFQQIDTNSDGYLTVDELQTALQKQHENTNLAELKKVMEFIDTDKNGKINYSEFLACCLESSLIQTEMYLEYIFKELDQDKSGRISKNEIIRIFHEHQFETGKNVEQIIEECDKNKDGEIDYKEFLEAMGLKK